MEVLKPSLDRYNNQIHNSAKTTPNNARNLDNVIQARTNLILKEKRNRKYPNMSQGDYVKIFDKGKGNYVSREETKSQWNERKHKVILVGRDMMNKRFYKLEGMSKKYNRDELLLVWLVIVVCSSVFAFLFFSHLFYLCLFCIFLLLLSYLLPCFFLYTFQNMCPFFAACLFSSYFLLFIVIVMPFVFSLYFCILCLDMFYQKRRCSLVASQDSFLALPTIHLLSQFVPFSLMLKS